MHRPTCLAASTLSLWVLHGRRGAWAPCICEVYLVYRELVPFDAIYLPPSSCRYPLVALSFVSFPVPSLWGFLRKGVPTSGNRGFLLDAFCYPPSRTSCLHYIFYLCQPFSCSHYSFHFSASLPSCGLLFLAFSHLSSYLVSSLLPSHTREVANW